LIGEEGEHDKTNWRIKYRKMRGKNLEKRQEAEQSPSCETTKKKKRMSIALGGKKG